MARSGTVTDLRLLMAQLSRQRHARRRIALLVVLLLLVGITDGASLLLLVPLLQGLGSDGVVRLTLPVVGTVQTTLAAMLVLVVVVVAIRAALQAYTEVLGARLRLELADALRLDTFDALLAARWTFFLTRRRSDLVQQLTFDVTRTSMALDSLLQSAVNLVLGVATAVVALVLSPGLTLAVLVAAGVLAVAMAPSVRASYGFGSEVNDRVRTFAATVDDSLHSLRLVRAHDAASPWVAALRREAAGLRAAQLAFTVRTSRARALAQAAAALGAAAVVGVSVARGLSPAVVVVLVVVFARLLDRVLQGVRLGQMVANTLPAVRALADLTADARAAREAPEGLDRDQQRHQIATNQDTGAIVDLDQAPGAVVALRAAAFRYPGVEQDALDGVDLDVHRGQITALAGPSGAGKSTVVDLVLGLLTPTSGTLLIDGAPLTPAGLGAWRARVAYVPQEVALVPGTLRDNLVWSLPADQPRTDEDCRTALADAAADFVDRLPEGLDTVLGDAGLRLSGGERQRVALARALLRRPELLVLDEATSALDGDTERRVQAHLRALRGRTTVLLVAHRPGTLAVADHVVVLDRGRVAESGPLRELVVRPSLLADLLATAE